MWMRGVSGVSEPVRRTVSAANGRSPACGLDVAGQGPVVFDVVAVDQGTVSGGIGGSDGNVGQQSCQIGERGFGSARFGSITSGMMRITTRMCGIVGSTR